MEKILWVVVWGRGVLLGFEVSCEHERDGSHDKTDLLVGEKVPFRCSGSE